MDVVNTKDEITANLLVFDSYRTSNRKEYRSFFTERFRLGKIFVVGLINDKRIFCPSRFAGYKECTMEKHKAFPSKDGRITAPIISKLLKSKGSRYFCERFFRASCSKNQQKLRDHQCLRLPRFVLVTSFRPNKGSKQRFQMT